MTAARAVLPPHADKKLSTWITYMQNPACGAGQPEHPTHIRVEGTRKTAVPGHPECVKVAVFLVFVNMGTVDLARIEDTVTRSTVDTLRMTRDGCIRR